MCLTFCIFWKLTLVQLVFRYNTLCVFVWRSLYCRYLMLLCRYHLLEYSSVYFLHLIISHSTSFQLFWSVLSQCKSESKSQGLVTKSELKKWQFLYFCFVLFRVLICCSCVILLKFVSLLRSRVCSVALQLYGDHICNSAAIFSSYYLMFMFSRFSYLHYGQLMVDADTWKLNIIDTSFLVHFLSIGSTLQYSQHVVFILAVVGQLNCF